MSRKLHEGRSLGQVQFHEGHVDLDLRPLAAGGVPDLAKSLDLREKGVEVRAPPYPEICPGGRRVERDRDPAETSLDEAAADGRGQKMPIRVEADDRGGRGKSLQEVREEGVEKRLPRPVKADATSLAEKRKETPPRLGIHVAARRGGVGARVAAHHARRNDVAARRKLQPDLLRKRRGEAPVRDSRRIMPSAIFDSLADFTLQDTPILVGGDQEPRALPLLRPRRITAEERAVTLPRRGEGPILGGRGNVRPEVAAAHEAEAEFPGSLGESNEVDGAAEHLLVKMDNELFVALGRREAPDRGIEPVQGALPERS